MQQILLVFYVLFFATGFMGGAALFLLSLRVRSRALPWFLVFQITFLVGIGLILLYFFRTADPQEDARLVTHGLPAVIMAVNALLWMEIIVIARRVSPSPRRWRAPVVLASLAALLIALKSLTNAALIMGGVTVPQPLWTLLSHGLTLLAMVAFGVTLRGPIRSSEPPALHRLFRSYGLLAILFAPSGLIEFAVVLSDLPWLPYVSLDHLLYFAWNTVSMAAVAVLMRPATDGGAGGDGVSLERIRALGLSAREAEIAGLIGRGLTNREIAEQLFISPATVRTHVYNLYQKVGAGSRVELLNMLRS